MILDYYGFVYRNEDRVLTDVIYTYRECQEYSTKIQEMLMSQMNYKSVLSVSIMTVRDATKL